MSQKASAQTQEYAVSAQACAYSNERLTARVSPPPLSDTEPTRGRHKLTFFWKAHLIFGRLLRKSRSSCLTFFPPPLKMIQHGAHCSPCARMVGCKVAIRFSSPLGPTTAIQHGFPCDRFMVVYTHIRGVIYRLGWGGRKGRNATVIWVRDDITSSVIDSWWYIRADEE